MYRLLFFLFLLIQPLSQKADLWEITSGQVHFESDAPLEIIKASSNQLRGILDLSNNTFAFTIPMESFQGFNSSLQREHFNESYVESMRFPRATFTGKIIEDIGNIGPQSMTVRAKGTLTVHGISKERIIEAEIFKKNNQIVISSNFDVILEDHDIKIPRVVNQKIAESIMVNVKAQLEKRS